MPFGLVNAPSTFHHIKNQIFKPFLRKFVLVFFDDILLYSVCEGEHVKHLCEVFKLLQQHSLVAKLSKCRSSTNSVHYLGHVISQEVVATDPTKIEAILEWPILETVKHITGLMGLSGIITYLLKLCTESQPMNTMLKKNVKFTQFVEAQLSFEALKKALVTALVLTLPNFNEEFIIEIDASNVSIGAMLIQRRQPIVYISRNFQLSIRHYQFMTRNYLQFFWL